MSTNQPLIASSIQTLFGPFTPSIQLNLELVQLRRVKIQLEHQIVPYLQLDKARNMFLNLLIKHNRKSMSRAPELERHWRTKDETSQMRNGKDFCWLSNNFNFKLNLSAKIISLEKNFIRGERLTSSFDMECFQALFYSSRCLGLRSDNILSV